MTKILRRKVLDNCSPLFYNDDRRGMKNWNLECKIQFESIDVK